MQKLVVALLFFGLTCFAVNVVTSPGYVEIRHQQTVLAITDRTGFASFDITLPATVVFSKPGYLPKEVLLTDGVMTYHVQMVPAVTLAVDTQPTEASVFINGVFYGRTPVEVVLEPGEKTLIIEKDGYCRLTETIKALPFEKTQLSYKLSTIPKVSINSEPVSTVWLNNQKIGQTPVQAELKPGRYNIKLSAENFFELTEEIHVTNDQNQSFSFTLTPCATIKVNVMPNHAVVEYENQRKIQPAIFSNLPLRKIQLKISAEGFEEQSVEFIPKQGLNELNISLEPTVKILTIDAPEDTMVYVDGLSVGRGSGKIKVSGDLHWIEAKLGEKSWAGIVDLTQTDTVKVNFDVATLIMPKVEDVKYIVEGLTFYPPAITYLPKGFHSIEIHSQSSVKRTLEFKAGTLTLIKPSEEYGYLNVLGEAVSKCYMNGQFIGLTPVLFYSLKPGTYTVQVGGKEFQIQIEAGQIVNVR
ncbi:MAG: PEGA domain-containing protein [Pseudothermotoga sp.]